MMDPYELEDIWINAFAALGGATLSTSDGVFDGGAIADPDPKPLVELLRSDTPMPLAARDTLAELLAPGKPPIYNWKLVPETLKNIDPIAEQIAGVAAFCNNREAGMTSELAADSAGIRGARQIQRYRGILERLGNRLRVNSPSKPR